MKTKTSHQLASELLAGPDLPICVRDMAADSVEASIKVPAAYLITGIDEFGDRGEHIEIHAEGTCEDGEPI
jgi:hypothetical protein